MNKKWLKICSVLMLVTFVLPGCSSVQKASDFNGLSTPAGNAVHLNTTNIGVHLIFGTGSAVLGNATLEQTMRDFTKAAKAEGASKVRVVQSSRTALWFVFPPFSFIFTPVITNVAGDAIK